MLIGSDKTHLTNHTGDKSSYNVFVSCGNLASDIRTKCSTRAWLLVAQLPIPKWEQEKISGVLDQRLFHKCFDIIFERAKECSKIAVMCVGPDGYRYKIRMGHGGHIADFPEQGTIVCRKYGSSPISQANKMQLGDPDPHPFRTREVILNDIKEVTARLSSQGFEEPMLSASKSRQDYLQQMTKYLKKYRVIAREIGVNCVTKPYWEDWFSVEPWQIVVPDPLHQWFKLFIDHLFDWAKSLLTPAEVDKRLEVLQPHPGFRHFRNGVTRYRQHTGREQRDLLRCIVGILHGHPQIPEKVMKVFRSFADFVYIGQYKSHSLKTLEYMQVALQVFHKNKHSVAHLRDGAQQQREFWIPKIEAMHHTTSLIITRGSVPQYSTEQVEAGHQPTKQVYGATNKKEGFPAQMCCRLDGKEKIHQIYGYLMWTECNPELALDEEDDQDDSDIESDSSDSETSGQNLRPRKVRRSNIDAAFRRKVASKLLSSAMPKPVTNGFCGNHLSESNETTAFKLTARITFMDQTVQHMSTIYKLPDLQGAIGDYFKDERGAPSRNRKRTSSPNCTLDVALIDTWRQIRIQTKATIDGSLVPFVTCCAVAPNTDPKRDIPNGWCHFVLIKDHTEQKYVGIRGSHFMW